MVINSLPHVAQGVLQLLELDEQIVFGIQSLCHHGILKVKREPLLDALMPERAARSMNNAISRTSGRPGCCRAEEVQLDLHG